VMSKTELGGLPTLIFQMVPHPGRAGGRAPNSEDLQGVPDLAADVDPAARDDVVLAVPLRPYILCVFNEVGGG
jgi:hypothetical protein